MEDVAAAEPADVDLLGAELPAGPAIGEHGAIAGAVDHGDDHATAGGHDGPDKVDPPSGDLLGSEPRRTVVAALRDQPCLCAEVGRPGCDVRGLSARRHMRGRRRVVVAGGRALKPHDHVEQEVTDSADEHA